MSVNIFFKSILLFVLMLISFLCAFVSFDFAKDVKETGLFVFTNVFLVILPISNLALWIRSNKDDETLLVTMSAFIQLIFSIAMFAFFSKIIDVFGFLEIFSASIGFIMLFIHHTTKREEEDRETRWFSDLLSVLLMTLTIYFSIINLISTSNSKGFLYILSSVALMLLALGNCLSWFRLRYEFYFLSWNLTAVLAILISLAQMGLAFLMIRYFACEQWLVIFFLSGLELLFQVLYITRVFSSGRFVLSLLFLLLLNAPFILGIVFGIRTLFFSK